MRRSSVVLIHLQIASKHFQKAWENVIFVLDEHVRG